MRSLSKSLPCALFAAVLLATAAGCGSIAPRPASTDAASVLVTPPADWRVHDGQRIRIAAPLMVSGNHRLARNGEVVVAFDGRLYAPTEVATPGVDAKALAAGNRRRSLVLALGETAQVAPADWRAGGIVDGVEGTLRVGEHGPRLEVAALPALRPAPRPAPPPRAGELRLASLNLENLFNGDGAGGGFPTARGARTPGEYLAQQARLVAALAALDADIVAVLEVENDGYDARSSLAQLVAALDPGGARWRFVDAGEGPGSDPIRVGLLYRADRVRPMGAPATRAEGPFATLSRAPLAQAFRAGDGPAFVVVANHFKSKGCRDASAGDADQGDGQSCWNATRRASGAQLRDWLAGDPTGSGSTLVAVLGDLNAYAMEEPVRDFIAAGWQDAFAASGRAPASPAYTYVYDAQAGRLDHALLSPALAARLLSASAWHSNADEADNAAEQAINGGEQAVKPWRSSDHDPVVVDLRLRTP
ncbi:ExeM/NucH family extracellular endonuclease [Luteimonas sp. MC1825]|uniref:ExeM/NucH family extracellular endonuclease n=1 Tax=Luteimonas sp. MC1825 TaxID=2761107 RepID=UPI00160A5573|nr:ExeM/NucH family extracellular endonuclease [Luteimonas sp. MC1825]MBB6600518.1 ExeM/NucH family extracellular endonuclease [Luteimonas sp. MC1825]QOC88177.1 ExeM/NucH family extracellular endonuclease [Luteimonas sp. MC1825]